MRAVRGVLSFRAMRGSTGATATRPLDDGAVVEPASDAPSFATATHEVLFAEARARAVRCDACGEEIARGDVDEDEGFAVPGRGMYVWTRGDEVRREEVPLCAACAGAIGQAALARWEIEEEEG